MKETRFIDQNRERWQELETMLDGQTKDPDKLSDLFVQVTDDLSYSRSFYGNRVVRVYLNQLAQRVFGTLLKNSLNRRERFIRFWKTEVPAAMYAGRKEMMFSLLLFSVCFIFGVLASRYNPDFAATILGESYISMTNENIDKGDPMAVYKDKDALNMFLYIANNNFRVAIFSFMSGLLMMVGCVGMIIYNGIMVGAFQYFFVQRGLFVDSVLTIWMHGTFEISAIIISGGAGLMLGKSLVFPGTFTRLQSLRIASRQGIRIILGMSPFLLVAAIIEGFVTRLTELNDIIRLILILLMAALVFMYFVVQPYRIGKSEKLRLDDERLPAEQTFEAGFGHVKSTGEIFGEAFQLYSRFFRHLLPTFLILAAVFTAYIFFYWDENDVFQLNHSYFFYEKLGLIWNLEKIPGFIVMPVMAIAFLAARFGRTWMNDPVLNPEHHKLPVGRMIRNTLISALIALPFFFLFYLPEAGLLLFLSSIPLLFFTVSMIGISPAPGENSLHKAIGFIEFGFLRIVGLYLILAIPCMLVLLLTDSASWFFDLEYLSWVYEMDADTFAKIRACWKLFLSITGQLLIIPVLFSGMSLLMHALNEVRFAEGLKKRLKELNLIPDRTNG